MHKTLAVRLHVAEHHALAAATRSVNEDMSFLANLGEIREHVHEKFTGIFSCHVLRCLNGERIPKLAKALHVRCLRFFLSCR